MSKQILLLALWSSLTKTSSENNADGNATGPDFVEVGLYGNGDLLHETSTRSTDESSEDESSEQSISSHHSDISVGNPAEKTLTVSHEQAKVALEETDTDRFCLICHEEFCDSNGNLSENTVLSRCHIDKKLFHATCLLNWFYTQTVELKSANSCPHCKSVFGDEVEKLAVWSVDQFILHPTQDLAENLRRIIKMDSKNQIYSNLTKSSNIPQSKLCNALDSIQDTQDEELKKFKYFIVSLLKHQDDERKNSAYAYNAFVEVSQNILSNFEEAKNKENIADLLNQLSSEKIHSLVSTINGNRFLDVTRRVEIINWILKTTRFSRFCFFTSKEIKNILSILIKTGYQESSILATRIISGIEPIFTDLEYYELIDLLAPKVSGACKDLHLCKIFSEILFNTSRSEIIEYTAKRLIAVYKGNRSLEREDISDMFKLNPLLYPRLVSKFLNEKTMMKKIIDYNFENGKKHFNIDGILQLFVYIRRDSRADALEYFMEKGFKVGFFEKPGSFECSAIVKECVILGCPEASRDLFERIEDGDNIFDTLSHADIKSLFESIRMSKELNIEEHFKFNLEAPVYVKYLSVFLPFLPEKSRLPAIKEIFSKNSLITSSNTMLNVANLEEIIANIMQFPERKEMLNVLADSIKLWELRHMKKALLNVIERDHGIVALIELLHSFNIPCLNIPPIGENFGGSSEWSDFNFQNTVLSDDINDLRVMQALSAIKLEHFDIFFDKMNLPAQ